MYQFEIQIIPIDDTTQKDYHIGMSEYSEPELVIPALRFIRDNSTGVTTTQMIEHLTDVLHPSGYDMEILQGRNDTHFSQKVRNLKSHDTLTKHGWVNYQRIRGNGLWTIAAPGRQYLRTMGL